MLGRMKCLMIAMLLLVAAAKANADEKLDMVLLEMGAASMNDIRQVAEDQSITQPTYHSVQRERTVFTGVISNTTPQGMVIFSDDGCRVTVGTNVVHDRYEQGQALTNFVASFNPISAILPAVASNGAPNQVKVEYSNVYYILDDVGELDIDGCTLFLYDVKVDLDIANGQGGSLLDEDKEETPGAFTVANLNDTDGDGTTDKDDGDVPGEEDLMQLVLRKPEPDLGDKVKLTLPAGVKLWKNATKSSGEETGTEFNTSDLPKTLWVEVTAKSGALRDKEIEMEYKGCKDKVQLTGVWTEKTGMKNQNADALWADAGDPMKTTFNNVVGKFGINFAAPSGFFHYSIGLEFTVSPAGIGGEPGIVFDVTRQIEFKDWTIDAGVVNERKPWKTFPAADTANDDTNQSDEDNTPENDHVYVVDGPGENNNGAHDQVVSRNNFYEFTRVRFDGAALSGNNDTGSRCSDKIGWHAFYWVEKDGGKYKQRAGKINEVNEGHGTLDPAPVP